MRTDWKTLFLFSKKDRNAAIVLLSLILLVMLSVYFYTPATTLSPIVITTLEQEMAKQGMDTTAGEPLSFVPSGENDEGENSTGTLFKFDPNTLDAEGFKKLGLRDKTVRTLINYRSKGGQFRKPEDLKKIYGLRPEEADRLIPYVEIAGKQTSFAAAYQPSGYTKKAPAVIDINTATADDWKALPAIGDVLANRVVKYRDKIGGFTSVAQVKQTYGLSDSAFKVIQPYLKLGTMPTVKETAVVQNAPSGGKVNINTASLTQLKSSGHLPEEVAQAIVIYRSQHGNFSTVEDLKKIVFINEEMYQQIAPFVVVE